MSTIVGHALVGAAISVAASSRVPSASKRAVVGVTVLAAVLPDLDVVLLLTLRDGGAAHRGLSHSLLAAGAIAAVLAAASRRMTRLQLRAAFLLLFAAGVSHLLLDWAMGAGPPVRPFAPFSFSGYLAPVRLVPTAYYGWSAAGYASPLFWAGNTLAVALELLLFAPLIIALQRTSALRLRALAGATSILAWVVTLGIFK